MLIFLCIIYHCGLLHISIKENKEYIMENVECIEITRNEIIIKMLSLV
jgi:hypothetical protein